MSIDIEKKEKLFNIIREYLKKRSENDPKFPRFEYLKSELIVSDNNELKLLLRSLEDDGRLIRKVSKYDIIEKKEPEKIEIVKQKKQIDISSLIFKVFVLSLTLLSVYVSLYFSFNFFKINNAVFMAVFFAIIVVGFFLVFFELMIYVALSKLKFYLKVLIIIPCLFFYLLLSLFSMITTIAAQYRSVKENTYYIDAFAENKSIIKKDLNDLELELKALRVERDILQSFLYKLNSHDYEYIKINNRLLNKDAVIELKIKAIADKRSKLIDYNSKYVHNDFFYMWLSKIVGVSISTLQFILFSFVSVIVDLLASTGLAVVLFFKK